MKFVHAADLHLDSPLRGLARYEGAPVEALRRATRAALQNLVELCLDEQVAFLLLAGDLLDGEQRDYATGLYLAAQLSRLREADIAVYLVRGNHDAASSVGKRLALPDNVTELSTRHPQTIHDERLGVAIHGQGFDQRVETADLAAAYPAPVSGALNVGLLHTSLDGRPGHEPYAPTTLAVLLDKGYDYWALGHVHAREVVHREPWIVFPGNLQGRHVRETGAKGASLVTVTDGKIVDVAHRALDVVRWEQLVVDVTACEHGDAVVEAAREALEGALAGADGRLLAARLTLTGRSPAHAALVADPEQWEAALRAAANDVAGEGAWLEKIVLATSTVIDLDELRSRDDPLGQLVVGLDELVGDDDGLAALAAELAEFEQKLPREARSGPDGVRLELDDMRQLVRDVQQLLVPRLVERGGA